MPPLPAAPAPELVAARVAALAPTLNGAPWALDLKRSDPIMPLMAAMGAPWAIVQMVRASGEPNATRTFTLSADGLRDQLVAAGVIANRTEDTAWTWAPFSRASPVGPQPACLSLDAEGRLAMVAHNVPKGLVVTSTMEPVVPDADAPNVTRDVLVVNLTVTDTLGKEVVRLRRIFTRARGGVNA